MSISLICDSCQKPMALDDFFSCAKCVNKLEHEVLDLKEQLYKSKQHNQWLRYHPDGSKEREDDFHGWIKIENAVFSKNSWEEIDKLIDQEIKGFIITLKKEAMKRWKECQKK